MLENVRCSVNARAVYRSYSGCVTDTYRSLYTLTPHIYTPPYSPPYYDIRT